MFKLFQAYACMAAGGPVVSGLTYHSHTKALTIKVRCIPSEDIANAA